MDCLRLFSSDYQNLSGLPKSGQDYSCKSHHDECDGEFDDDSDHQGEHDVRGSEGHDEDVGGSQLLGPEQHHRNHHQVREQAHHNWREDEKVCSMYCQKFNCFKNV